MDNIKQAIADQFMWNFIILNKSDNKFRQSFIISEKPGYLLEKT